MNIRKLKLALTVGLLNKEQIDGVQSIRELMQDFRSEVGNLLGVTQVSHLRLNSALERRSYALQFERCQLAVDLINNPRTKTQVVEGFSVSN